MYLFKYYRPDFFFDKAIRYNELYFSAGAQLNDPNDLSIEYRFDNNLMFWNVLLRSPCEYSFKDLTQLLDLSDSKIHKALNKVFKGKRIKGNLESLDALFEMQTNEIFEILYNNLSFDSIDKTIYENQSDPKDFLARKCETGIKERLYKKITPAVFSVSFSSKALERMMWAHYAAGFSGCVVIYKAQKISSGNDNHIEMKLTDSLFSNNFFSFPVKPIKYSNQSKEVSILDPRSNIVDLVLTKNRFWRYESEYRIFVPEGNIGINGERNIKGTVNRNSGHVFHHENNAVQGIIFGPRMSRLKKEEIWQIIKSNMMNTNAKSFYFFDAVLSSSGKIDILNGQIAQKNQGYDLYKTTLTQVELLSVLNMLGISK